MQVMFSMPPTPNTDRTRWYWLELGFPDANPETKGPWDLKFTVDLIRQRYAELAAKLLERCLRPGFDHDMLRLRNARDCAIEEVTRIADRRANERRHR